MKKIAVFIVDDHPLMRSALEIAIGSSENMSVVGEASNGQEALGVIPRVKPDVVLMDLMMPKMNGWEAIAALKAINDQICILVLSSAQEEKKIFEAIQAGALGYITKDAQRDEIIRAIRAVANGEAYLPPQVAGKIMRSIRQPQSELEGVSKKYLEPLTIRQQEIFELIGQGLTNKEIAARLHISDATLRVHIHHMMERMGFENRRELIVHAIRRQSKKEG